MNNANHAGKTGKSFYAALSLSVAMVGAGCWYAFSAANRRTVSRIPQQSITETTSAATTTVTTLTAPATSVTVTSRTTDAVQDAEEAAALLRHSTASTAPAETTVTAMTTAAAETPCAPVAGELVQPFSKGELVKSPTTGIWATHNGADFAAEIGAEVCAVLDGTVTKIAQDPLYGVCVTLLHEDGTVTRCCGLNENLDVIAGQIVERGTVLGTVGDTNDAESAMEPHLHFEVLQNGSYLDPIEFLSAAR